MLVVSTRGHLVDYCTSATKRLLDLFSSGSTTANPSGSFLVSESFGAVSFLAHLLTRIRFLRYSPIKKGFQAVVTPV